MLHTRLMFACLGLLLVSGCGTEVYEERLKETNAFFEYRQSLDRVLQNGAWTSPTTISVRIPKGFTPLPAPPVPKEGEPIPEDTRQPAYLGLYLPGLVGAWQGEFPCDDGANRPVFLYICSNHQTFLDLAKAPTGPDPALFLADLEGALSNTMQVSLPPGEVAQVGNNVRYAESCPKVGKYAVPKRFTGVTFVPPGVLPQVGLEIKAQLYEHYSGPIQVAVLAIYPAAVRGRIDEKLLTALETFSVSSTMPKMPTSNPAGNQGGGSKAAF